MDFKVLTSKDTAELQQMLRWWRIHKNPRQQHRRRLVSRSGGGESAVSPRRARVTADAGAGSTITANLYHLTTGVEQTTGDEAGITVYAIMSGGSALNEGSRLLETGDDVTVYKSVFDNAGTPEDRWYTTEGFDVTEECECTTP